MALEISDTQVRDILPRPTSTMHQSETPNVDLNYVPLLWKSLDDDRVSEVPTPIIVSVTNEELKALRAVNHGVLDDILTNKIRPAFLQQQQCICIACQTQQASSMINTIAFYPQAPEGPTIVDSTPFAVCDSTTCIHRATRRAHSHRSEISSAGPGFADVESEVCDNCNGIQKVSIHGRLKQCAQCKAKLYCSKKCQTEHWYKTHKYFCKSVSK
jgi:hypothetical protein